MDICDQRKFHTGVIRGPVGTTPGSHVSVAISLSCCPVACKRHRVERLCYKTGNIYSYLTVFMKVP